MRNKLLTIFILIGSIILCSCTKDNQTLFDNQEKSIETYVNAFLEQYPDTRNFQSGSATILVATEGQGEELKKNGKVTFDYVGYTFNGNISERNIIATNIREIAKSVGMDTTYDAMFQPVTESPSDKTLLEGLADGLIGIKAGEERLVLFCGKYGYPKKINGTISANSAMAYHIIAKSISN